MFNSKLIYNKYYIFFLFYISVLIIYLFSKYTSSNFSFTKKLKKTSKSIEVQLDNFTHYPKIHLSMFNNNKIIYHNSSLLYFNDCNQDSSIKCNSLIFYLNLLSFNKLKNNKIKLNFNKLNSNFISSNNDIFNFVNLDQFNKPLIKNIMSKYNIWGVYPDYNNQYIYIVYYKNIKDDNNQIYISKYNINGSLIKNIGAIDLKVPSINLSSFSVNFKPYLLYSDYKSNLFFILKTFCNEKKTNIYRLYKFTSNGELTFYINDINEYLNIEYTSNIEKILITNQTNELVVLVNHHTDKNNLYQQLILHKINHSNSIPKRFKISKINNNSASNLVSLFAISSNDEVIFFKKDSNKRGVYNFYFFNKFGKFLYQKDLYSDHIISSLFKYISYFNNEFIVYNFFFKKITVNFFT